MMAPTDSFHTRLLARLRRPAPSNPAEVAAEGAQEIAPPAAIGPEGPNAPSEGPARPSPEASPEVERPAPSSPRRWPWRRWSIRAALVALLGPVALIVPLLVIDPPTTAMMLVRTVQRLRADRSPAYPRRDVVPLEAISKPLIRAVLASEDDAFYLHDGFDVRQIKRALDDRGRGRRVRGASTISQQTVKNLFLWSGRSLIRKGLEAYLTVYLELILPKDRILEIYLNLVECGDGFFGVEACARHHFKRPASKVDPESAARLAAIFPNPRKWSPFGEYASERVPDILEAMNRAVPTRAEPE